VALSSLARGQLTAAALFAGLVVTAALMPVPYVRLSPGPTVDVLADDPPLIAISGTETYPTEGRLDLTTVSELGGPRSRLQLLQAVRGWLDPDRTVLPERVLFPEPVSGEQVEQADNAAMEMSQEDAVSAAVDHLGLPAQQQVVVREVSADSPADGLLQPGDVVLTIDGKPVTEADQVREAVRSVAPGDEVVFGIERDGAAQSVAVVTAPSPTDAAIPYVGIVTAEVLVPDSFDVTISLDDVGGPSAGLVFSLGIVDQLTPQQETGGRFVAGTGTIDAAGTVGPIGGLPQKLAAARDAGAEVFLVPADNCSDSIGVDVGEMRLIRVETLDQAVSALAALRDGGPEPVGCG
jgi:Lon-like protease